MAISLIDSIKNHPQTGLLTYEGAQYNRVIYEGKTIWWKKIVNIDDSFSIWGNGSLGNISGNRNSCDCSGSASGTGICPYDWSQATSSVSGSGLIFSGTKYFYWSYSGTGGIGGSTYARIVDKFGTVVCNIPVNTKVDISKYADGNYYWQANHTRWTGANVGKGTVGPTVSLNVSVSSS